jgi:AcrR family transcriptional regulator
MPVRRSDLSASARIRNAALEGFALRGVAATSIRDVATAAGVSPGLVQHHFGTKEGLRAAVNEYVIAVAVETFADLVSEDSPEAWRTMGDTVTAWVNDNAIALRYLARGLSEGDADAIAIFESLLEIAQGTWLEPLAQAGALRPGVDREWAAIHVFVFNLACVLFEPAISHLLPAPFFSPEQLQRWNAATTELYRHALITPPPATPATPATPAPGGPPPARRRRRASG